MSIISMIFIYVAMFPSGFILKPVFHFNRIVTYRSIFFCVEVISSTLPLRKQRNTLCFGTIRLKRKTGLTHPQSFQIAPKKFHPMMHGNSL